MNYFLEVPTDAYETTSINCTGITSISYNLEWSKPRIVITYFNGEKLVVDLQKDCDKEKIKMQLENKSNALTDRLVRQGNFFKR